MYCTDLKCIAEAAASHIHELYAQTIQEKDIFTLVLSGGKTPEALHGMLCSKEFNNKFDWNKVCLFWGDERYVHKNDPESNYGMAERTLLRHIPIPEKNVYPIPTETETVTEAAKLYEERLKGFFHDRDAYAGTPPMPLFDLILLGMGKDGHTASLFLDRPIDPNESAWVEAVTIPPTYPTRERITLTLPVLNNAAHVAFLVSGKAKRETLIEVLRGAEPGREKYAAQLIASRADIVWFTDIELPEMSND
jgi:6-phosphogluconolactonase